MRRLERLWMELFMHQKDVGLVDVLLKLRVLNINLHGEYSNACQERYFKTRRKEIDHHNNIEMRNTRRQYYPAPKHIKPTRSRTYK